MNSYRLERIAWKDRLNSVELRSYTSPPSASYKWSKVNLWNVWRYIIILNVKNGLLSFSSIVLKTYFFYIYFACFGWLSICLDPINVKTAEPIGSIKRFQTNFVFLRSMKKWWQKATFKHLKSRDKGIRRFFFII